MVLGRLYLEVPRVLGGDKKKATIIWKGLRVRRQRLNAPQLAEAYATGRDQDAHKQIDFILKMTPGPVIFPERTKLWRSEELEKET